MKKLIPFALILSLFAISSCGKKAEEPQKPAQEAPAAEAKAADDAKADAKTDDAKADAKADDAKADAKADDTKADDAKPADAKADDAKAVAHIGDDGKDYEPANPDEEVYHELVIEYVNLPENKVIKSEYDPYGDYTYEYIVDDIAVIGNARIKGIDADKDAVAKAVLTWDGQPYNVKVEEDEALGDKFTYPTWKITYLTGHNEDTNEHIVYLIQGNTGDYLLSLAAGADFIDDYVDKFNALIPNISMRDVVRKSK